MAVEPDRGEVIGCSVGDGPALVRQEADSERAHQVERVGPGGRAGARSAALPLLSPWPIPFGTHPSCPSWPSRQPSQTTSKHDPCRDPAPCSYRVQ